MTSTAEERAAQIRAELELMVGAVEFAETLPAGTETLIAQAIREAENDKLEEAALIAEACRSGEHSDYGAGLDAAANEIADAIRTLKSKD